MKHRSRIEITSLILEAANGGEVRKTKITNNVNLSYLAISNLKNI